MNCPHCGWHVKEDKRVAELVAQLKYFRDAACEAHKIHRGSPIDDAVIIDVMHEEVATLEAEKAKSARLREALATFPYAEYDEALISGCDANAAWDCFTEAASKHVKAALAPTVSDNPDPE